jgi:hypothetical protein
MPAFLSEAPTRALQPGSNLENPGQVQPDGEQHPCHADHKRGRLKLETPTRRGTGRPHRQQGRRQSHECRQHPGGVEQRVRPRLIARETGRQSNRLDGQYWKHAGHQIENQPAKECEQQHHR